MTTAPIRKPDGNGHLWAGVGLLAVFAGLIAYELTVNRTVLETDPELYGELGSSKPAGQARASSVRWWHGWRDSSADPPAAAGWPQWRGPHRDGVAAAFPLLTAWPEGGPPEKWHADVGRGYSSMAVAGGRLFTLLREGDEEQALCLDAATGRELWRQGYSTPWPGGSPLTPGSYGPEPRSTPTVDGDRVYTVGVTGLLHCRSVTDGRLLWWHDLIGNYGAPWPKWGVAGSPLVEGGVVIVAPGGANAVLAFDKRTGVEAWRATGVDEPAGYSSPVAATLGGRRQVVAFLGEGVVGLDAGTGRKLWSFAWPTGFQVNAATPLIYHTEADGRRNDYVFISSGYDRGCALVKVSGDGDDFKARLVYKTNALRSHFASPVRHGEHVYGFDENFLVSLSLRTGKTCWKQRGFNKGSLLRSGDTLVVLGETGNLALVEATPDEYRELKSARPLPWPPKETRCWTMPVLADGRLYVRGQPVDAEQPGRLACFDLNAK
jgi:outer membrane protein assembly factor BamB